MVRLTVLQSALVALGCGLMLSALFMDRLAAAWEDFRYPNAVHWQQLRIVPDGTQKIVVPGDRVLVVKQPGSSLTLFLRPPDRVTPEELVRELCRRDGCSRPTMPEDDANRAVGTYRSRGYAMQIVLIRLGDGALWAEYRGKPDGLVAFDNVLDDVALQLAERRATVSD
jgi:hypothetical protein